MVAAHTRASAPHNTIQPLIAESDRIWTHVGREEFASSCSMRSTYLEHVNKIRLEFERDRCAHGIKTVIGNLYSLVAGAVP